MFGGAFSGFGGQLFGNWRFWAKRRFRARVDPLAFSRFWAFLENFEGGGELEPPLFPLLRSNSWNSPFHVRAPGAVDRNGRSVLYGYSQEAG